MRYRDKLDWIEKYAAGKRILYIGSVDDDRGNIDKHDVLYRALRDKWDDVIAVVHSPGEAARLGALGLPAIPADPEAMELGKEFDLVLATDNIEHMSNCGLFLRSVARHLARGGNFLVTTPNPLGFVRIGELLFGRRGKANRAHTCWFTGQVLCQLAKRYGMIVVDEVFIDDMYGYHGSKRGAPGSRLPSRIARSLLRSLNFIVCRALPRFSETTGYVLMKRNGRD
ncbi:MAG: methyltransferase domain-containing protein [Candidatus Eisenbacteria bacterium]